MKTNKSDVMVIQADKQITVPNILLYPLMALAIYSVIVPLLIMDIWISVYQMIFFSGLGIPKIKRSDYYTFDHWDLTKLNLWQRINCVYCDYANATAAYAKAIINQTEIYTCAIKNFRKRKGQEHQEKFHEFEKFVR